MELTIRFVDVPIKVQLPPRMLANEMGNNSLLLEISYLSDSSVTILMNTITTAVELIKAEMDPVINIKTGTIKKTGHPRNFFRPLAIHEITPFRSRAAAKIIRHRMVMTALFEKPLMASSGVTRPNSIRKPIMQKAILSIGNTSKANSMIITLISRNTKPISKVIFCI